MKKLDELFLSTKHFLLVDKKINYNNPNTAVLVSVIQNGQTEHLVKEYLAELKFLAETAGAETVKM
ncbi:MAG: hypothetical protein ABIR50_03275, partial [Ginsengibacter sp.]